VLGVNLIPAKSSWLNFKISTLSINFSILLQGDGIRGYKPSLFFSPNPLTKPDGSRNTSCDFENSDKTFSTIHETKEII